ncbi:FtsH-binding integral membrane protein [Rhodovulum iodosum]|uniref:FtsH-binding integral membrane protein n=1 Tax=Rhodovulum iodosum TaxID=68291 RepID=A0ABV3XQ29_9RHOB|nr:ceramidase domain-containing protein [Rhodovulum robiginosum]RSK31402.1 hypothetical protein EJA01_14755 [Rhodovulum robiginosum]
MDWTRQIDAYCERTDPGLWAEPVNALTNVAFVLAAIVMWRRGADLPLARALALVLGAIGVGSFLFHTRATVWASLADVLPIVAFILLYIYAANRAFWRLGRIPALLIAALFLPFAAATAPLFGQIPGLGSSSAYAPVPVLIGVYALLLRRRAPATAGGLALGAALLILSLTFRTLDGPLCAVTQFGTHFLWHLLNGVMLAWMIEVYCRHERAAR